MRDGETAPTSAMCCRRVGAACLSIAGHSRAADVRSIPHTVGDGRSFGAPGYPVVVADRAEVTRVAPAWQPAALPDEGPGPVRRIPRCLLSQVLGVMANLDGRRIWPDRSLEAAERPAVEVAAWLPGYPPGKQESVGLAEAQPRERPYVMLLAGSIELPAETRKTAVPGLRRRAASVLSPLLPKTAMTAADPESEKTPRRAGLLCDAPKRTRTSTRLSRTRPSTWRVYQFRHRRRRAPSIAPAMACPPPAGPPAPGE